MVDGLVKSRKIDFMPQHIDWKIDKVAICCGQNKMLGLFTSASELRSNIIKGCFG